MLSQLEQSVEWIEERSGISPEIGLILGSGLSEAMSSLKEEENFNWSDIPRFPVPSVEGHRGILSLGKIGSREVVVQRGRIHWYEGQPMENIVFPVRVMHLLGVRVLLITNAAGGINREYEPGDLVLIKDHINGTGVNPLRGQNIDELGPRFPDLSEAYSAPLRKLSFDVACEMNLKLKEGIYVMAPGPSYETPAEIDAFGKLGADLVGMSTVPEVIAANHCGVKVLGISCVTNKAAGLQHKLTHEEVIEVTQQTNEILGTLIEKIVIRVDDPGK